MKYCFGEKAPNWLVMLGWTRKASQLFSSKLASYKIWSLTIAYDKLPSLNFCPDPTNLIVVLFRVFSTNWTLLEWKEAFVWDERSNNSFTVCPKRELKKEIPASIWNPPKLDYTTNQSEASSFRGRGVQPTWKKVLKKRLLFKFDSWLLLQLILNSSAQ